jgi:hypothetical protein
MWGRIFGFFKRKKTQTGMLRARSLAVLEPKQNLLKSTSYAYLPRSNLKSFSLSTGQFEKLRKFLLFKFIIFN